MIRWTVVAVVAVGLCACGTPEAVRELATKTAANVSLVGSSLDNVGSSAVEVAAARARNVARLKETIREVRGRHSLDIVLANTTGDAKAVASKDKIRAWMVEARSAARGMTVEEFKKAGENEAVDQYSADVEAIMAELETLDTKVKALQRVSKTLAKLSKKEDVAQQIKFLVKYAKTVRKELDEKEEAADKSAGSAKSKADGAADKATTATANAKKGVK